MKKNLIWLENGKSQGKRGSGSAKKSASSRKSGENRKQVPSRDFFSLLANLLKLKIFYMGERRNNDFHQYN